MTPSATTIPGIQYRSRPRATTRHPGTATSPAAALCKSPGTPWPEVRQRIQDKLRP